MNPPELALYSSSQGWNALFGISEGASPLVTLPIAFLFFFAFILYPFFFLLGFAERKLAADLQARVGPNRTPLRGVLQAFADAVKLGAKAGGKDRSRAERYGVALKSAALFSSFAFLPLGASLIFLDSDVSAFLPILCFILVFLVTALSREGVSDVEDEILAHRQSFLRLSACIPALIAVTIPVARSGSARWTTLLSSQSEGVLSWTAFSSPFGLFGFFVFLFSGLVALQHPPFQSLDREVRHRSGAQLGVFELFQFYAFFVWCVVASALFLGGQAPREVSDISALWVIYQLMVTLLKTGIIYLVLRVVSRALPQLRQDQMTEFCWRILTPVAIVSLIGEFIWLRITGWGST